MVKYLLSTNGDGIKGNSLQFATKGAPHKFNDFHHSINSNIPMLTNKDTWIDRNRPWR